MILLLQFLGTTAFFLYMLFTVLAIVKGAPYIRSKKKSIDSILTLLGNNRDSALIDLGAGDGQVLLALAKNGHTNLTGVEINPFIVIYARIRVFLAGYHGVIRISWGNMWKIKTSNYSRIIVYGFPTIMSEMYRKIKSENLGRQKTLISNSFPVPDETISDQDGTVYKYIIEESN